MVCMLIEWHRNVNRFISALGTPPKLPTTSLLDPRPHGDETRLILPGRIVGYFVQDWWRSDGLGVCQSTAVSDSNPGSSGHLGDRQQFYIVKLALLLDPLGIHVALCHSKLGEHDCRSTVLIVRWVLAATEYASSVTFRCQPYKRL